jgi:hypothetical protein
MIYIHNGVPFIHKEEYDYITCKKMGKTQVHHAKWNKPDSENTVFSLTCGICRGRKGLKVKGY